MAPVKREPPSVTSVAPTAKRSYRSPRRAAQARATKQAIVDVATRRFLADGYAATTVDGIAAAAEVSPATVYAAFGSKRALLLAAVDAAIVGDVEDVPLVERDWVVALPSIEDRSARIRALYRGLRETYERTARFGAVLEEAAAGDAELRAVVADFGERQRSDALVFRRIIVGDGVLFDGLTLEHDRDAIWLFSNPSSFERLVQECGWTPAEWEDWIVGLSEVLLAERDRRAAAAT